MEERCYPTLYQINTRVRIQQISQEIGHPATLDDIPDSELDHLVQSGVDWVYMLGVWQTGEVGQAVSRSNPDLRREAQSTLHDLQERRYMRVVLCHQFL